VTAFAGVSLLLPGHYLDVSLGEAGRNGSAAAVRDRVYWEIDFPDQGNEDPARDEKNLLDRFEEVLLRAVERRLRADVPVVSYLSGGVDSGMVVAMACKVRGEPIPTFTIRIDDPTLDETGEAAVTSRHVGARPIVTHCGAAEVLATYPRLVAAAEGPVIDTSCAALLLLAEEVHRQGYKVALTGEGADEWLAGYPWYKGHKLLSYLDVIPGLRVSQWVRRLFLRLTGAPRFPREIIRRAQESVGGHNGWLDMYGLVSLSKWRFFGEGLRQTVLEHDPYADLHLNRERLRRWHPLNRALYLGARVHLPGLLLNAKGDRIAMHSSVETRYPFLDEEVFTFLASLHPRWKLHGLREKHILRQLAERWLPAEVARRRKAMFRAPLDSFHVENPPAFVGQLFSEESLRKTGYFDPAAVTYWRAAFRQMRPNSTQRISVEMGLAGVLSTQLWHHLFIDPTLADLPGAAAFTQPARSHAAAVRGGAHGN
jgi:asparagine synthase (glutamine-hydrolysing)